MIVDDRIAEDALIESAKTAELAAKGSRVLDAGGTNWITRSSPDGHGGRGRGHLPKYIQSVARGIMESGKAKAVAIPTAINAIKRWARGGGDVSAEVRAASVAALAEWEALKAKSKARRGAKNLREAAMFRALVLVTERLEEADDHPRAAAHEAARRTLTTI